MPDNQERQKRSMTYLGATTSTCPICLSLVNAKILTDNQKVYFEKYCPAHGSTRALINEDVEYYLKAREYCRAGTVPHAFASKVRDGCPHDCGLCPDHEQHTCHPIIEITDHCNLSCPVCMVSNRHRGHLRLETFDKMIAGLVATEGRLENVALSGGEPSLHPDFWKLVALADRSEINRVSLVTNGLRIAEDLDFCRKCKEHNLYVILQWDGFDDRVYQQLRGRPLLKIKEQALANLEKWDIATQLIFTAARRVNEEQLGQTVRLLLSKKHLLSLVIQPLTFPFLCKTGRAPKDPDNFLYNALDRLTVAGVIKDLATQVPDVFKKADFFPLPCPDPQCVSLTYLLRLDNGSFVPFPRFVDMKKYLHLLSQSATLSPNLETEQALTEIINDLWSMAGEVPDSQSITRALRRAGQEIFSKPAGDGRASLRISEQQAKSVFIHHYMDPYTFDLARIRKCCHHYPRPDGRLMPVCSFNHFHRQKEADPFAA